MQKGVGIEKTRAVKYVKNTLWLLCDKVFRQGANFLIGISIAKQLGPTLFGDWNYVIALCALFSAFATLGLDTIVIKQIVARPQLTSKILGTALIVKLFGGLVVLIFSLASLLVIDGFRTDYIYLTLIIGIPYIFQAFDIAEYYFQAKVESRNAVYSRVLAFLVSTAWRIWLLYTKAPLIYFAISGSLELILSYGILFVLFLRKQQIQWKVYWNIAISLLKESWPLALSSVAVILYMRLDQVMLKSYTSSAEVGIYSAAVRICEMWYFVPMIMVSSIYPGLVKTFNKDIKLFNASMRALYFVFFWTSLIIATVLFLTGDFVIEILFGSKFGGAGEVLGIYGFSAVATFMGVASSQSLVMHNQTKISLYRTLMGLMVNVLLNFLLIATHGAKGAALATLIAYTISTYGLIFFKSTRPTALAMIESIWPTKELIKSIYSLTSKLIKGATA